MGLVNVTGEQVTKRVETYTVTVGRFKAPRKGKANPVWERVEKEKKETVKDVTYHTVTFPAGEAECTASRVGLAFDTACRMFTDGLANVRIWSFDGSMKKITAADVKRRDKALAITSKLISLDVPEAKKAA